MPGGYEPDGSRCGYSRDLDLRPRPHVLPISPRHDPIATVRSEGVPKIATAGGNADTAEQEARTLKRHHDAVRQTNAKRERAFKKGD